MAKYNKDMVQACADWVRKNGLIDFGGATLTDFCKAMGIEDQTYYRSVSYTHLTLPTIRLV